MAVVTSKDPFTVSRVAEYPGYTKAVFQIYKSGTLVKTINFAISPNSFSESYSVNRNLQKTNGGWFAMVSGNNVTQLSMSGYMLDTKNQLEKHAFLLNYQTYIEDHKTDSLEYYNPYSVKLYIEGREYQGYIAQVNFQKSAERQFLYSYSISFLAFSSKYTFKPTTTTTEYSATKMSAKTQISITTPAGVPASSSSGGSTQDVNSNDSALGFDKKVGKGTKTSEKTSSSQTTSSSDSSLKYSNNPRALLTTDNYSTTPKQSNNPRAKSNLKSPNIDSTGKLCPLVSNYSGGGRTRTYKLVDPAGARWSRLR